MKLSKGDRVCYRSEKAGGHEYVTGEVVADTIRGVKVELDDFYECLENQYSKVQEYVDESRILEYWDSQ